MAVLRVTSRYHRVAIKEPLISTPFLQGWPIHPCIRVTIVVYEKSCPPRARDSPSRAIRSKYPSDWIEEGWKGGWIQTAKSAYVYGNKSDFANRSIYTREILREGWIILKIFVHFFFTSLYFFLLLCEFEDVHRVCVFITKNVYFLFLFYLICYVFVCWILIIIKNKNFF